MRKFLILWHRNAHERALHRTAMINATAHFLALKAKRGIQRWKQLTDESAKRRSIEDHACFAMATKRAHETLEAWISASRKANSRRAKMETFEENRVLKVTQNSFHIWKVTVEGINQVRDVVELFLRRSILRKAVPILQQWRKLVLKRKFEIWAAKMVNDRRKLKMKEDVLSEWRRIWVSTLEKRKRDEAFERKVSNAESIVLWVRTRLSVRYALRDWLQELRNVDTLHEIEKRVTECSNKARLQLVFLLWADICWQEKREKEREALRDELGNSLEKCLKDRRIKHIFIEWYRRMILVKNERIIQQREKEREEIVRKRLLEEKQILQSRHFSNHLFSHSSHAPASKNSLTESISIHPAAPLFSRVHQSQSLPPPVILPSSIHTNGIITPSITNHSMMTNVASNNITAMQKNSSFHPFIASQEDRVFSHPLPTTLLVAENTSDSPQITTIPKPTKTYTSASAYLPFSKVLLNSVSMPTTSTNGRPIHQSLPESYSGKVDMNTELNISYSQQGQSQPLTSMNGHSSSTRMHSAITTTSALQSDLPQQNLVRGGREASTFSALNFLHPVTTQQTSAQLPVSSSSLQLTESLPKSLALNIPPRTSVNNTSTAPPLSTHRSVNSFSQQTISIRQPQPQQQHSTSPHLSFNAINHYPSESEILVSTDRQPISSNNPTTMHKKQMISAVQSFDNPPVTSSASFVQVLKKRSRSPHFQSISAEPTALVSHRKSASQQLLGKDTNPQTQSLKDLLALSSSSSPDAVNRTPNPVLRKSQSASSSLISSFRPSMNPQQHPSPYPVTEFQVRQSDDENDGFDNGEYRHKNIKIFDSQRNPSSMSLPSSRVPSPPQQHSSHITPLPSPSKSKQQSSTSSQVALGPKASVSETLSHLHGPAFDLGFLGDDSSSSSELGFVKKSESVGNLLLPSKSLKDHEIYNSISQKDKIPAHLANLLQRTQVDREDEKEGFFATLGKKNQEESIVNSNKNKHENIKYDYPSLTSPSTFSSVSSFHEKLQKIGHFATSPGHGLDSSPKFEMKTDSVIASSRQFDESVIVLSPNDLSIFNRIKNSLDASKLRDTNS
eukprot:GDKJ01031863.1.p1 GENE.GDKJ01031863.1~~GDKJ01031863.1.p1  ORF type:complete len:1191 (-),score=265.65 GDKJ01031863.1:42-3257(-)